MAGKAGARKTGAEGADDAESRPKGSRAAGAGPAPPWTSRAGTARLSAPKPPRAQSTTLLEASCSQMLTAAPPRLASETMGLDHGEARAPGSAGGGVQTDGPRPTSDPDVGAAQPGVWSAAGLGVALSQPPQAGADPAWAAAGPGPLGRSTPSRRQEMS